MNTDHVTTGFARERDTENGKTARSSARTKASRETQPVERLRALVSRAKDLPAIFDAQLKENPYRLLAIVAGAGFGAGAVLSSRIGRTLLMTAGGYAVNEMLRAEAKHLVSKLDAAREVS